MSGKEEKCADFRLLLEIAGPWNASVKCVFSLIVSAADRGFFFLNTGSTQQKINADNYPIQSIFYCLLSRTLGS